MGTLRLPLSLRKSVVALQVRHYPLEAQVKQSMGQAAQVYQSTLNICNFGDNGQNA
jgi:hypothetical protein